MRNGCPLAAPRLRHGDAAGHVTLLLCGVAQTAAIPCQAMQHRAHAIAWVLLAGCADAGSGGSSGDGSDGGVGTTGVGATGAMTTAPMTTADATSGAAVDSSGGGVDATSAGASETGAEGRDDSNDRSKFFGDPRCDVADVVLCDSFEAGSLDTTVWEANGDVSIDTGKAARGSGSLHAHTEGNGLAFVRETVTFPADGNRYFGRMFVWIDAVPIAPDWAHWTLVGAAGSGDPSEIRVGGQYNPFAGMNLFGIGTDGGPTGDWTNLDDDPPGAPQAVVVQDWVCLEWMHDGGANETRFWWDADEHVSLATTATQHGGDQGADYVMPQFESVWIGWWLYQGGPSPDHYDVWIDEVAIDRERIGCVL